jgi:hypothetical protein
MLASLTGSAVTLAGTDNMGQVSAGYIKVTGHLRKQLRQEVLGEAEDPAGGESEGTILISTRLKQSRSVKCTF